MIAPGRRRIGPVDVAIVQAFRLVHDDDWSPSTAAARLRAIVGSDAVLRRARVRVQRGLVDWPNDVAERASATLQAAEETGRVT